MRKTFRPWTHPFAKWAAAPVFVSVAALIAPDVSAAPAGPATAAPVCPEVLRFTQPRLQDERPINLCDYAGQVVLVVNTASKCGYTPQYKSLDALNARFKARGFVVLGFPSNDFGQQEPGDNAAIAEFCENQFAVRFPMFAKTVVRGAAGSPATPFYAGLAARTGQAPQWNFHKYLISRSGVVRSYVSDVDPQNPAFAKAIEDLLVAK
ncbi:MAG: glutathione peroxidase [Chitinophagaceae bacterium]|nr:glutathione peroxidase [Rubrivivax sp.]